MKLTKVNKDEEYDNDKPYLIGESKGCIVGFIQLASGNYYYIYSSNEIKLPNDDNADELNKIINHLNILGYNVYKQK